MHDGKGDTFADRRAGKAEDAHTFEPGNESYEHRTMQVAASLAARVYVLVWGLSSGGEIGAVKVVIHRTAYCGNDRTLPHSCHATRAPPAAQRRAIASPKPLDAPVITMTWSRNSTVILKYA